MAATQTKEVVRYHLNPSTRCDICSKVFILDFIDGKITRGPWANMCLDCYGEHGVGIGKGQGQHYRLEQSTVKWKKVAG